jgi:hypothetical protein
LLLYSSYLPLGVPNWTVIHINRTAGIRSAIAFLGLYVDDILLIGNNVPFLNKVKDYLKSKFSMKDLGEAAYILGIKIYRDRTRCLIGLSQGIYLDKVVKRFHMDKSKKGMLPMITSKPLSKAQRPQTDEERQYMSEVPFASTIGSIMYAMICTRPDVSFDLSATSRHQSVLERNTRLQ